jgi:hypothetical protein
MNRHLFIIGAQRSGTTYLYRILDAHPEVCMAKPIRPEPKYFMYPANTASAHDVYLNKYFSDVGDASWLGEKSTSYIESEDAALAIHQTIPDATILVLLRDPLERAISHYYFTKSHGLESYDFEQAIKQEPSRVHSWHSAGTSVSPYKYIERGKYAHYLERWEKLFGKDRLILLVAEQFIGEQAKISALYDRLGIAPDFVPPSLKDRVNAGSAERAQFKLSDELKESLHAMFHPWNRKLEDRYGLDLSCWEKEG